MSNTSKKLLILDRYSRKIIAKYPSAKEAAEDLGLSLKTIYGAICRKSAAYDCYWVWEDDYDSWEPAPVTFKRVKDIKCSDKLKRLLENEDSN